MKEQRLGKWKPPHHTGSSAGSVLLAVLGVSLILMLAGVTMVIVSRQSLHRIQRTVRYAQAQAVAEAGIADMAAKLGTNYTLWQSNSLSASFGSNGAYHVTTQPMTNGNVLITSDGIYLDASNRTIMEMLGTVEDYNNLLYNTNSSIMSGGNIELSTGAYHMFGDVAANGTISGANTNQIDGQITNNVTPPLVLPAFNFDSYRQLAISNGVYYSTNATLSGTPIAAPANGIMYVNGNLTIQNNSSFAGTIVVNGNITINNHFAQTNFPGTTNMPALLSTGIVDLGNHGVYYGVVYAAVKFIDINNTEIHGGVICGGETVIKNHVWIWPGGGYPVWDPLNPYVTPSAPIPGGWLK